MRTLAYDFALVIVVAFLICAPPIVFISLMAMAVGIL